MPLTVIADRGSAKVTPGWMVVCGGILCQFGLTGGTLVFTSFMKPVLDDVGWSRSAYTLYMLPLLAGLSFGNSLAGMLTDRLGPGVVLSSGITIVTMGYLLFSRVTELWHIYLVALVLGLGASGVGDVPVTAAVSSWYRKHRGIAVGMVNVGSNLGGAILPIVAEVVTRRSSWREGLVWVGLAGWLLLFPVAAAISAARPPAAPDAFEGSASPGLSYPDARTEIDFRAIIRTRAFWILAGAVFAYLFYTFGVLFNFAAFLRDSGFSDATAALGFGVSIGLGVIGKLGMGLLADRLSARTAAIAVYGLTVVGATLLLVVGRVPELLSVLLVVHGLVTAQQVVIPLIVAEQFGVRSFGRAYGAMLLTLLPAGFGGTAFAAWVFDVFGSYLPAFACFAALNLAATTALALLPRVPTPAPNALEPTRQTIA